MVCAVVICQVFWLHKKQRELEEIVRYQLYPKLEFWVLQVTREKRKGKLNKAFLHILRQIFTIFQKYRKKTEKIIRIWQKWRIAWFKLPQPNYLSDFMYVHGYPENICLGTRSVPTEEIGKTERNRNLCSRVAWVKASAEVFSSISNGFLLGLSLFLHDVQNSDQPALLLGEQGEDI